MHPVARDVAVPEPGVIVGVTVHEVTGNGVKAQLLKVIGHFPFPHDVAVPIHFVDHVVKQHLVGNGGHVDVLVREDQRIAAVGFGIGTGHVIAHVAVPGVLVGVSVHEVTGNCVKAQLL